MPAPKQLQEDIFGQLKTSFLREGEQQSRRLLRSLETGFDPAEAQDLAHHWIGCGGFLGFSKISESAVEIQVLLHRPNSEVGDRLRAGFDEMVRLFTDSMGQRAAPAASPVGQRADPLTDRVVGLIGFGAAEVERIGTALEKSPAFWRAMPCDEAPPESPRLSRFDLLVVRLCDAPARCPWRPSAVGGRTKPLLLVGPGEELARFPVRRHAQDFLVEPWRLDEMLIRCRQILSDAPHVEAGLAAPPVQSGGAAGRLRVVVADDDPTITEVLRTTLENHNLDCRVAHDGGEALEMAKTLLPDLLVLDVMMPKLDGFEVLTRLRADRATQGIPVVLLTARQQEADIVRGFGLGAAEYIVKPFNPMELVARLQRFLHKAA